MENTIKNETQKLRSGAGRPSECIGSLSKNCSNNSNKKEVEQEAISDLLDIFMRSFYDYDEDYGFLNSLEGEYSPINSNVLLKEKLEETTNYRGGHMRGEIVIASHFIMNDKKNESTYKYVAVMPGAVKEDISIEEGDDYIEVKYVAFGKDQSLRASKHVGSTIDSKTIEYKDGILKFESVVVANTIKYKVK